MKDWVLRGPDGEKTETLWYGYYRRDGELVRDSWVIACDKPDRVGPFTMTRAVTHSPWEYDTRDERRPKTKSKGA